MLIPDDLDMELDQFVERFEAARGDDPEVDVSHFMPSPSHPRYLVIGCELLRVDMELHAAAGHMISLDDYHRRFPKICQNRDCMQELAAEAERVSPKEFSAPVDTALHKGPSQRPALPSPGQSICGFRVLAELGRGAFSHVYLATDASLSQRPVVLKLSTQFPGEAQLLSRLQHKNIVPIYSLHQWQQFHILCMPFLGALTLADLLKGDQASHSKPLSGQALINTLMTQASQTWKDELSIATPVPMAAPLPQTTDRGLSSQLKSEVSRMSTTELALWIVAELADGLTHAHSRGILHRDIKPANILLSDDGLPMLLDFNLAAETQPTAKMEKVVGGTLRYMAPEQLLAVQRQNDGLDARTDIYSLGVVLYELLLQQPPFPDRTGHAQDVLRQMQIDRQSVPQLKPDWQRGLTPAVINIMGKAIAPEPSQRYDSASQFRDELRRQLSASPLRFTRDRSIRERLGKWNARHPRLSSVTIVSLVSLALLITTISIAWVARNRAQRLAAVDWFHHVEQTESVARNLLACQNAPTSAIDTWLAQSDSVLAQASHSHLARLVPEQQTQAQAYLSHIHFFRAQGEVTLAARSDSEQRIKHLENAQRELQRSQALQPSDQTQSWMAAVEMASKSSSGDDVRPPAPSAAIVHQQLTMAADSVHRHASNHWHWLSMGQLHLALGQLEPARTDFELSRQLNQAEPLPTFFLGVVEMKRRNFEAAEQWFSDALQRDPQCPEALISRAATRVELKKYPAAISDLDQLGSRIDRFPRAWFIRERAQARLGQSKLARQSLANGLELTPCDAVGWNARGEAFLRTTPPQPERALADFETAIQLDPTFVNSYENAAHVLSEHLNQPIRAIEKLTAVLAVEPNYALAYSSRAVLQARNGQVEAARRDIDSALALQRSAIICYQAASALAVLGKEKNSPIKLADGGIQFDSSAQALELLKEALRQDPKLNKLMQGDNDLLIFHDSPEFQQLLSAAQKLQ